MFSNEYGEAAVEVLDILDNTNKADVEKIPSSFIKFLVDNASEDYRVNFDHSKTIDQLNLKQKTKEILGVIYINWWCNKKDQENYKEQIEEQERKRQEEIREKYNPNKIFENREKKKICNETQDKIQQRNEMLAIVKDEENIFKRVIDKIIRFFKK